MTPPDDNDLIPMGAPTANFDVVMRGFDRNQVTDAIGRLEDDLRTLISEREAAIKHAKDVRKRLESAKTENDSLKDQLKANEAPSFENMGGRIASMLRLAEEEAEEIRQAARDDAEKIRADADEARGTADTDIARRRAESEQYVADSRAEADDVLAKAKAEAAEHLDSHRRQAEEHLSSTQTQAAELLAASEAKRASAEEDFDIALRHRRTAAHQQESERDQTTRAEAAGRLQEAKEKAEALASQAHAEAGSTISAANEQSRALIAAAEAEVARLEQLRTNLASQIHSIGALVAEVPAQLAVAPEALDPNRVITAPSAELPAEPELTGTPTDEQAATELAGTLDPLPSSRTADEALADSAMPQEAGTDDQSVAADAETQGQPEDAAVDTQSTDDAPADDVSDDEPLAAADDTDAPDESTDDVEYTVETADALPDGDDAESQPPAERTMQISALRPRRPKPGQRRM